MLKTKADNVYKKINGKLSKIPQFAENVQIQQTGNFTPQGNIPNIGRDYVFTNKALEIDMNKVSEPFKGQRGIYLMKVLERTPFDENIYSTQSTNLRNMLLQEKRKQICYSMDRKDKRNCRHCG